MGDLLGLGQLFGQSRGARNTNPTSYRGRGTGLDEAGDPGRQHALLRPVLLIMQDRALGHKHGHTNARFLERARPLGSAIDDEIEKAQAAVDAVQETRPENPSADLGERDVLISIANAISVCLHSPENPQRPNPKPQALSPKP